ncbi:RNase III inhibitor [Pseudodesulfovibrio sp. F-1]|uniref:RNase III inhibitor n=1 Tax=Pseudodesulfovibrio alkaliphilus TaxID=2661613 RepID=A0A7K1KK12_9BACT|nr:macro domain-containing protein [Pseudodesulfovibrio alkaliphilus]MUM76331.1 RNase III inhibitor [Pseudodesulfovibrio alkaliphilus]
MRRWKSGPGHLVIHQGDITTLAVECVVNAANSRLAGGGGVDGAIHRAAGIQKLQHACQSIIAGIGRLETGQAVITPGFDLPAPFIIHTVGPIWRGGGQGEPELLRQCHGNSLALARQHGLERIAFPAISCGAYGYPVDLAAPVALDALRQGLDAGLAAEVHLVLHDAAALAVWTAHAERIL